ncbi:copper-binding protein [Oxalicibacterium faecigallinarum]|nr:copper-binding protein [Oxalicibacterium faecigallinarum]
MARGGSGAASVSTDSNTSEGTIRKVDKENQKITIRHGELKNLDMPPMTMVFRVQDPAFVEAVNVGDEVKFVAEKLEGKFTVTHVEKKN